MKFLKLSFCFALCLLGVACTGRDADPVPVSTYTPEASVTETATPEGIPTQEIIPTPEATKEPATPSPTPDPMIAQWLKAGDSEILMTVSRIREYNFTIMENSPELFNMGAVPDSLQGTYISSAMGKISGLSSKYGEDRKVIGSAKAKEIEDNMNISALKDEIIPLRAVIVDRSHLRTMPWEGAVHNSATDVHDRNQETELYAGSPAWIFHTSKDGRFYFIRTYSYTGWVSTDSVAVIENDAQWKSVIDVYKNAYGKGSDFVTITSSFVKVEGKTLDMGSVFSLVSEDSNGYKVILPARDENGKYIELEAYISPKDCCKGFLPYSRENMLIQAHKYCGVFYSWGGKGEGIDCSGFVANVMRSFGFMLSRNTSQQYKYAINIYDTSSMTSGEKKVLLESLDIPAVLYYSGHAMIYLGYKDGQCHMIHAGENRPVEQSVISDMSKVIRIVCFG